MCGVIGVAIQGVTEEQIQLVSQVLLESRIRGKHATGVTYLKGGKLHTLKYPISSDKFLEKHSISDFVDKGDLTMIAHCRYSTSDLETNQPLGEDGLSIVHNGVISQEPPDQWEKLYGYKTQTENDTELLLRSVEKGKAPLSEWSQASISAIELRKDKSLRFYRNGKRPLYKSDLGNGTLVTSTRDIVRRIDRNLDPVVVEPGKYHSLDKSLNPSVSTDEKAQINDLQTITKTYYARDFTWGFEIEWGDIDRNLSIPSHLGAWESAETDVVNLIPPYENVACDPLGLEPPVGGEINTKPTNSWVEQVERILEIKALFEDHGNTPTAGCVNHGHIHAHIPGLIDDLPALKRLITYIKANQAETVDGVYGFYDHPEMKTCKGATTYLKYDGGRLMPDYMSDNILNLAKDFNSFIRLHAAGKDGKSMGRPFRYAINTYCLKHTTTVEFRCFRSTTKRDELEDQFRFVELFLSSALNGGPPVSEILASRDWKFPTFYWDKKQYMGWLKTKYGKERGEKRRQFHQVSGATVIGPVSSDAFRSCISSDPEDKFAKTFVAKAKAMNLWDRCLGVWENGELLGAVITTLSKRSPKVANLQLLHTFAKHRGKGVGKTLVTHSLVQAKEQGASYWRVSSEPEAVEFYQKLGIRFLGRQKSEAHLCIFRIEGSSFAQGVYDLEDPVIKNAVFSKARGGCVEVF